MFFDQAEMVHKLFDKHFQAYGVLIQYEFKRTVLQEQQGYLDSMSLPLGVAKNAALLENVFVLMVCVLNKIPVFVVGKPGTI